MNCKLCNRKKVFKYNADYKTEPVICDKCFSKFLPSINLSKIPISEKAYIWHFYLFEKFENNNLLKYFNQYLRPIYLLIAHYKKTALIFDKFPDEDLLFYLDQINFGDIIIITYKI